MLTNVFPPHFINLFYGVNSHDLFFLHPVLYKKIVRDLEFNWQKLLLLIFLHDVEKLEINLWFSFTSV